MYNSQPLFAEVDTYLRGKGYSLFNIAVPLGKKARELECNINIEGPLSRIINNYK